MSRPPHPGPELSALRRGLTVALLGLALVMAQAWLAAHELEHLFHEPEEPCGVCVVGLGLGAPLPAAALPPTTVAAATAVAGIDRGVTPHSRDYHPQAARAPPAQSSIMSS